MDSIVLIIGLKSCIWLGENCSVRFLEIQQMGFCMENKEHLKNVSVFTSV